MVNFARPITVVELKINVAEYSQQEVSDPSPEQVCQRYASDFINILGSEKVTTELSQLIVRAHFDGEATYLPGHDPEGELDGEGDSLSINY